MRPPDWNLCDAKPELKSDQAELGVVEIAVDPLVFRESTRHVGPEHLEAALGVSEGKSGQNPEQAVERLAEQLAERVLPCRQLGSRDRARADDEVEAIVQNSDEFRCLIERRGHVDVGEEDQIPGGGFQPGAYRGSLPAMTPELQDLQPALEPGGPTEKSDGLVLGAVVDDDQLAKGKRCRSHP